jgi:hypothetical protein
MLFSERERLNSLKEVYLSLNTIPEAIWTAQTGSINPSLLRISILSRVTESIEIYYTFIYHSAINTYILLHEKVFRQDSPRLTETYYKLPIGNARCFWRQLLLKNEFSHQEQ